MLPKEKSKPKTNLLDYSILIHGMPKIGKSALASGAEGVLFADTEGGLSGLSVYKTPISNWNCGNDESFLTVCKEFTTEKHGYRNLCIDTVDNLAKMCQSHVMAKHEIAHPSDLEWGKGWALVTTEFMRPLMKLAVSQYGLIFISHSKEVEIKTRISKITKAVPTLQNYIWSQVEGFVDIILYYRTVLTEDGERRELRTKPSENWTAGDRTKKLLIKDPIVIEDDVNNWVTLEKIFQGGK